MASCSFSLVTALKDDNSKIKRGNASNNLADCGGQIYYREYFKMSKSTFQLLYYTTEQIVTWLNREKVIQQKTKIRLTRQEDFKTDSETENHR